MSFLVTEIEISNAVNVAIDDERLSVSLDDGRTISVPVSWYPRLLHGTNEERNNFRFIGNGSGINWPDLDEDISVQGLLAGRHSVESQKSLNKWLEKRTTREVSGD